MDYLPLSVAATVAYFYLADAQLMPEGESSLARRVALAAIALTQVAEIRTRQADGTLAATGHRQLEQELSRPLHGLPGPDLDALFIRRGDLHSALKALTAGKKLLEPPHDG